MSCYRYNTRETDDGYPTLENQYVEEFEGRNTFKFSSEFYPHGRKQFHIEEEFQEDECTLDATQWGSGEGRGTVCTGFNEERCWNQDKCYNIKNISDCQRTQGCTYVGPKDGRDGKCFGEQTLKIFKHCQDNVPGMEYGENSTYGIQACVDGRCDLDRCCNKPSSNPAPPANPTRPPTKPTRPPTKPTKPPVNPTKPPGSPDDPWYPPTPTQEPSEPSQPSSCNGYQTRALCRADGDCNWSNPIRSWGPFCEVSNPLPNPGNDNSKCRDKISRANCIIDSDCEWKGALNTWGPNRCFPKGSDYTEDNLDNDETIDKDSLIGNWGITDKTKVSIVCQNNDELDGICEEFKVKPQGEFNVMLTSQNMNIVSRNFGFQVFLDNDSIIMDFPNSNGVSSEYTVTSDGIVKTNIIVNSNDSDEYTFSGDLRTAIQYNNNELWVTIPGFILFDDDNGSEVKLYVYFDFELFRTSQEKVKDLSFLYN